jgi:MFS family permease
MTMTTPTGRRARLISLDRLPNPGGRRSHYGLTYATLLLAALSYSLMQSMVAPALVVIQRDVHASTTTVTWLLTAYLLSACVATPIVGRFGDIFGKRRMLICALGVLMIGTLVCALATSIEQLLVGRAIQGCSGALFPLSWGIIRDEFPRERVAPAVAVLSGVVGSGASLGIVLAGPITDTFSYNWLFWIPLTPIAIATAACFVVVPESPRSPTVRIDWLGGALLAAWLVAILLAVSEAGSWGWSSARTVGLFGVGAALLLAWISVELRTTEALVDMQMMRLRGVWTANVVGLLTGFGLFGAFVLLPRLAESPRSTGYGFGASVTRGSLFLLPMTGTLLLVSPLVGRAVNRWGPKQPIFVGSLLSAVGLAILTVAHAQPWEIYVESGLLGAGVGGVYSSLANQVIEWVPSTHTGVATGMNSIIRFIGHSFGAQVSAAVLAGTVVGGALPTGHGFTLAFALAAAASALAALVALASPTRRRGREPAQTSPGALGSRRGSGTGAGDARAREG